MRRYLPAVVLLLALAGCGGAPSEPPSGGAEDRAVAPIAQEAAPTGHAAVAAFFEALRQGDVEQAERYVVAGKVQRAALEDLARQRGAVAAEVGEADGRYVAVQLSSAQPMQYWPQCPFNVMLDATSERIEGVVSCALP